MLLTIDVGNTETVLGMFDDGTLIDHWRFSTGPERTVDELRLLVRGLIRESGNDPAALTAAALGSVVPPMTSALTELCRRHLAIPVSIIDAAAPLPIRIAIDEPLTLGADRIANTLAAAELYGRDTIAVDLGTATTFDCITATGDFIGGVISPGIQTGAETLVRRTAKLPRVELERPQTVIGKRTETALQSGVFFSAVDAIDGMVRRIRDEWARPDVWVVATGGLAPLIGGQCTTVNHIEPFLTLHGLAIAHRHLTARREQP